MALPARTGPLTWAQREWYADLGDEAENSSSAATNAAVEFPGHELPVEVATAAVQDVLSRHEGLRTLIERQPDGQRLQTACTVDGASRDTYLRIVADGPEAQAAYATARDTPFRLAAEWPVRFVLATGDGVVRRIGTVVDHAVIDAWGWKVLGADLDTALRVRAGDGKPWEADPEQPLDTALWETGPDGARYARRATAFWRRQYETLRDGLDGWTPPPSPRAGEKTLHAFRLASWKTADAAEGLAARGIRPATLYLTAFADAIGEVEGTAVVGVQTLNANRLTQGTQASVRKAVMPAPVVIRRGADPAGIGAQQLDGARFANLDPAVAAGLATELLGAYAHQGPTAARFNFLDNSVVPGHLNTTSLGGEGIRFVDPAVQGAVTEDPPRPGGSRFILSVQHQPLGALLTLACHADTAWRAAGPDMLRHIEAFMVRAAAR
ncbi:condensation domain-containing protein [Hamadaea tsunoensis]|uniref:condensation domain-containing protein n=1 Tax=Hamadaea tsunoensis TaxID=53368 RepID=UPI000551283A|nr:condensation domain-containing protein [Hamadaea tsunoensis]